MNIIQAALILQGGLYREEGSPELFAEMKESGLVAVFGASDDLMEFRGAINDEVGCCGGGDALFDVTGLLTNECECDDCPHFAKLEEKAKKITAIWLPETGESWAYETDVPHATFSIMEDSETYCQGIVFHMSSLSSSQ